VEQYQSTKDIYVAEYEWSPTDDLSQEEAVVIRDRFIEDFEDAITHARTIIWDKETQVWELFRYAEFGAPNDAPKNYAALYQRYRRIINMPKALDLNFGMIQGMKSPWVTETDTRGKSKLSKTKDRVRKGMDEIEELVHINVEHYVEILPTGPRFMQRTGKMRGPGARDMQYREMESVTFAEFGQLLFPDSDESDWV
jgi:hypothetical protein